MNRIRLIELFAGVGSQCSALKRINANFESWKISEWEVNATRSYSAIHSNDDKDYSIGMTENQLDESLIALGISSDGKEPMTDEKIKRKSIKEKREIYNAFKRTKNLGSITNIKGSDLEIVNPESFTYLLTYSFPCQDLSIAGKRKGMQKGSGTRSGLLWEVERLLEETENLPQVLLMENVPQVHGQKFIDDFENWMEYLEQKGYTNYWQDLNSRFYGVAQNRNRTFMVSMLGGLHFEFPRGFELKKIMKDYLEDGVDEKYYINNEKAQTLVNSLLVNGYVSDEKNDEIQVVGNLHDKENRTHQNGRVYSPDGIGPTLGAAHFGTEKYIIEDLFPISTKKGEIDIANNIMSGYFKSNMSGFNAENAVVEKIGQISNDGSQYGTVVSDVGCMSTLQAGCHGYANNVICESLMIKANNNRGYYEVKDGGVADLTYPASTTRRGRVQDDGTIAPAVTATGELHKFEKKSVYTYRIRKLTPKECWRLMGFTDNEFKKAKKVCSNSQLYKQAGNSIVVDVLCYIFENIIYALENPEKIKGQTTIFDFFN